MVHVLRELNCRTFRNVITQLVAKASSIVCVYFSIESGARDGNIRETKRETRIDEVGMDGAVNVDEHTISCQPLRTVTGGGVSMVKVRMLYGIELDIPVVFRAERNDAVRGSIFSMVPRSRLATPSCLSGAVN